MWFDHVTGFFVNYGWKPGNLTNTVQYMATNVTGRQFSDVYIGIDVWGRNVTGNFCLDKFICKQSTITKHNYTSHSRSLNTVNTPPGKSGVTKSLLMYAQIKHYYILMRIFLKLQIIFRWLEYQQSNGSNTSP